MGKWKVFEIKMTKPKGILSSARVRANILNALKEQGRIGVTDYFPLTSENWTSEPNYGYKVKYAGGNIKLSIYPEDDETGSENLGGEFVSNYQRWNWLNYGTRTRYAHMSRDWESKTTPGILGGNSPGAGYPMYLGPALPGIEARRWDKIIRREMRPGFVKAINNAIKKGIGGK